MELSAIIHVSTQRLCLCSDPSLKIGPVLVPTENEQQAVPPVHLHPRGPNLVSFGDVALFIYCTLSPGFGK